METFMNKIYCINMASQTFRKTFMAKQFEEYQLNNLVEFIEGVDINNQLVKDCVINRLCMPYVAALSQIAISYSHLKCWELIYSQKMSYGCIIEDDIRLYKDFLNIYQNAITYDIKQKMMTEPCILWLTGLSSIKKMNNSKEYEIKNNSTYQFVNIGAQYGNCMYVINYQLAKLLIDNFYPISMPSDDYVMKICNLYHVEKLSLLPIVAYDLSSHYYSSLWTEEDTKIKNNFARLSNSYATKHFITENNHLLNRRFKMHNSNLIIKSFCKKLLNNNDEIVPINYDLMPHFIITGNITSNMINTNSIICGAGIDHMDSIMIKPLCISLVRGPLTRKAFMEQNINCPKNYGDPFLITSLMYDKKYKIQNNKIGVYCIEKYKEKIIDHLGKSKKSSKLFNYINVDEDIFRLVDTIMNYRYILSTELFVVIICHSYKIPAIWLHSTHNNLPFMDYYKSIQLDDITSYNLISDLDNSLKTISYNIQVYPQPSYDIIKQLKTNIINSLTFIGDVKLIES